MGSSFFQLQMAGPGFCGGSFFFSVIFHPSSAIHGSSASGSLRLPRAYIIFFVSSRLQSPPPPMESPILEQRLPALATHLPTWWHHRWDPHHVLLLAGSCLFDQCSAPGRLALLCVGRPRALPSWFPPTLLLPGFSSLPAPVCNYLLALWAASCYCHCLVVPAIDGGGSFGRLACFGYPWGGAGWMDGCLPDPSAWYAWFVGG